MRCKSCLRTFSQPSKVTKDTQTCSICRGVKTRLKYRDLCERSPIFLVARIKNTNIIFDSHDHRLIQPMQSVYRKMS
jgi:hypothetical protein